MKKTPTLWTLFRTFFKIGLFTFGGGYAMIPLIESVCVDRWGWITHEEMLRITVLAESTPGPIAINCATFVGNRRRGFWGAAAATAGVVLPSFGIILLISGFLEQFLEIRIIASAFRGIRVAVGLLILDVGIRMAKTLPKEPIRIILLVAALILTVLISIFSWKISTITLLLTAALISLAVFFVQDRKGKDGEQA